MNQKPTSLIELDEISLKFGHQIIFNEANLVIRPEERACIIGRNGAGKSTLFRLIQNKQSYDAGEIRYRNDLRIAALDQSLPDEELGMLVRDVVENGLSDLQELLACLLYTSPSPRD